jgi:hypothetical protein
MIILLPFTFEFDSLFQDDLLDVLSVRVSFLSLIELPEGEFRVNSAKVESIRRSYALTSRL